MFYKNIFFTKCVLFLNFISNVPYLSAEFIKPSCKIETIYGTTIVTEPVIIDLINDKFMQRLKEVNQYGIDYYVYKPENYTRYDHSLGVFFLVRKYGACLREQIAALLHDVSHTVFSHVGDFLFNKFNNKDSHQDDIHYKFIKKTSLKNVLKKHGYKIKDILHKNGSFTCLEADLPDLCADRLEYNLFGGLLEGIININDINTILNDLKFKNGIWYFTDPKVAKLFANVTAYLTVNKWTSPDTMAIDLLSAETLKLALEVNLLSMDDIYYGYDSKIWSKLLLSKNHMVKNHVNKLLNFKNFYKLDSNNFDFFIKLKCRVVDPFVKLNYKFFRLSQIDKDFNLELNEIRSKLSKGLAIKLL